MVEKSLDVKLAKITADPNCGEFILADAKDADMAYGLAAPGMSPECHAQEGRFRSLEDYRETIRRVVREGIVDLVFMSPHTNSILTINEGLFEGSPVTPAVRANDATDMLIGREGTNLTGSLPSFRSTTIDNIQCGLAECAEHERGAGANLGLYSVAFHNDAELDRRTIESYRLFHLEAERKGFRHLLEVFDPNAARNPTDPDHADAFVSDNIMRLLAGVPEQGRPLLLLTAYHGPKFTEALARYDASLVIGIMGGLPGTTYDAFKLIAQAQACGARAALFGRRINQAEHQSSFIAILRRIVEGDVTPEEGVCAYHSVLQALNIQPQRPLEEDMRLTIGDIRYGGGGATSSLPLPERSTTSYNAVSRTLGAASAGRNQPNLAAMTSAERLAYHRKRLRGLGTGSS